MDGNSYAGAIAVLNDPLVTDKWANANQLVFLDNPSWLSQAQLESVDATDPPLSRNALVGI